MKPNLNHEWGLSCSCPECQPPAPRPWGKAIAWAAAISLPVYVLAWAIWTMLPA